MRLVDFLQHRIDVPRFEQLDRMPAEVGAEFFDEPAVISLCRLPPDVRFDVASFAVVIGRARNGPRMNVPARW
jgi:hypothetical protein